MTGGAEPLVRRGKRNARFTAISNDLIDHPDLSPEARIVLIYLLSKPDNWKLQIDDIRRLLGTGQTACGRNKTYEVIRELRSCAHVIAVEELQGGRFHRMTYFVFDEPHCDPEGFARAVRDGRDYEADAADCGQNPGASPRTENRDAAPEPCPEKPRPENRHVIKEREIQKTESPHPTPIGCTESGERREGGHSEFADLWSAWPEAERPRKRPVAERLFKRLAPDERRYAVQFASAFRAACIGHGAFALMIPYLRERSFREFVGGPEVDREGYFVIRPDRAEWAAWIAHYRTRVSGKIVDGMIERGFMLTRSRLPDAKTGGGASSDDVRPIPQNPSRNRPKKFPSRGLREPGALMARVGSRL